MLINLYECQSLFFTRSPQNRFRAQKTMSQSEFAFSNTADVTSQPIIKNTFYTPADDVYDGFFEAEEVNWDDGENHNNTDVVSEILGPITTEESADSAVLASDSVQQDDVSSEILAPNTPEQSADSSVPGFDSARLDDVIVNETPVDEMPTVANETPVNETPVVTTSTVDVIGIAEEAVPIATKHTVVVMPVSDMEITPVIQKTTQILFPITHTTMNRDDDLSFSDEEFFDEDVVVSVPIRAAASTSTESRTHKKSQKHKKHSHATAAAPAVSSAGARVPVVVDASVQSRRRHAFRPSALTEEEKRSRFNKYQKQRRDRMRNWVESIVTDLSLPDYTTTDEAIRQATIFIHNHMQCTAGASVTSSLLPPK